MFVNNYWFVYILCSSKLLAAIPPRKLILAKHVGNNIILTAMNWGQKRPFAIKQLFFISCHFKLCVLKTLWEFYFLKSLLWLCLFLLHLYNPLFCTNQKWAIRPSYYATTYVLYSDVKSTFFSRLNFVLCFG